MPEPRVFQGWPLTEVPLEWLRSREEHPDRGKATEVAPGVHIQVMSVGDQLFPDLRVGRGAQIAVWDERRGEDDGS